MRICLICPSYPPQEVTCGVGDYTRCLAEELVRQGEDVAVVTSDRYSGRTDGPVHILPVVPAWTLGAALRLTGPHMRPAADLIHLQYTPDLYGGSMGFALTPLLARLRPGGPPTVITFHTLIGGSFLAKGLAPLLLAAARRSISANEEVASMIRHRLPFLAGRMTEIPIGTNIRVVPLSSIPNLEAERAHLGLPEKGPLLAHFGLVYPGKGLETLLAALPEVLLAHPNSRLVIIGDTRPENRGYRTTLEAIAERLSIARSVIWTGRRPAEEVSRMLQISELFVVPFDGGASIRRGSLMAGLAHGLPVVSTFSSLPSAYLKDGVNIALVPPRDSQALATRITSLLAAPAETARLSEGARRLAGRFTWEAIARETRALYAQVLRR